MTVATTDGASVWGFRYSSEGQSRSLFYSTRSNPEAPVPGQPVAARLCDEPRLIVSEPLGDLQGAWNEVPESSYGVVRAGRDELAPFAPQPWAARAQAVAPAS